VGNIYFTHMTKLTAQFHIFIGENSLWNKGIGTKSTLLSINFLKVNYNLKKIYLKVKINNTSAIKVYKKCGFKIKKKIEDDNYYMTKNLIY
jgi:RimJ/RimL family protein N-acetyltransferase